MSEYLRPEILAGIGSLEIRARRVVEGFVSGRHNSPWHGFSVEFAQHREYSPGDDLRHLDWRVFGRCDRFYIKQYEEETNLRCHIALDCSASMRYPEHRVESGRMTKFEYAATLAASLAWLLIHQQDSAGLLLFDREIRAEIPPQASVAHLQSILRRLETARLDQPTETRRVLTHLHERLSPRSMFILISDLLDDPEHILPGLQRMAHARHESLVLHVLDADERTFPFTDNVQFEDLEQPDSAAPLSVDPQSLRRGYLEALGRYVERIQSACANASIDYLGLSTADPLDVALRRFLAARSHAIKTGV